MRRIIITPVAIDYPALCLKVIIETRSRVRSHDAQIQRLKARVPCKIPVTLKNSFIILIKSENERTENSDPMALDLTNRRHILTSGIRLLAHVLKHLVG